MRVDFQAKIEDNKCVISNTSIIAVIEYNDKTKINASLTVGEYRYSIEHGSDKNMRVLENDTEILKFKFDYMWGNATLIINGVETEYRIVGKAFKKGTRLVDGDNNDMIVVTTRGAWAMTDFDIQVVHPEVTEFLITITVYYHIYASMAKMRASLI